MNAPKLPFNRVIMQTAAGSKRLTVAEFEAIPLTERVRALLEKRVTFYRDYDPITQEEALRALRQR